MKRAARCPICLMPGAARDQRWRARKCPRRKRRQQLGSVSPRAPMEWAARPLRKRWRGARRPRGRQSFIGAEQQGAMSARLARQVRTRAPHTPCNSAHARRNPRPPTLVTNARV